MLMLLDAKAGLFKVKTFEFSLNAFTEFSDKIFVITEKGLKPATSCVRDQDVTTVPARHM